MSNKTKVDISFGIQGAESVVVIDEKIYNLQCWILVISGFVCGVIAASCFK